MATRFENGIVATLGKENKVLLNGSVVTDGEKIVAVGDFCTDETTLSKSGVR